MCDGRLWSVWIDPCVTIERIENGPPQLIAFVDDAAVERLRRAHVVWVEFGEGADLRGRESHGSLEDKPGDSFGAGRSGDRAHVHVIGGSAGQKTGGIDLDAGNQMVFTWGAGHVFPKLADSGIGGASVYGNGDAGDFAVGGAEHEVNDHGEWLAVNLLFAGMMKVELGEFEALGTDEKEVAVSRGVIDADGSVAVVDDVERAAFECEAQGGKRGFFRGANVDGRLLFAVACGVGGIEAGPMRGAVGTLVAPRSFPLGARNRGREDRGDSQTCKGQAKFSQDSRLAARSGM